MPYSSILGNKGQIIGDSTCNKEKMLSLITVLILSNTSSTLRKKDVIDSQKWLACNLSLKDQYLV